MKTCYRVKQYTDFPWTEVASQERLDSLRRVATAVEQKLHVARTASEPKVEVAFADEGYPQLLFGVKVWAYDERDAVKRAMRIISRGLTGVAGDQARGLTFPWGRTKITVVT